LLGNVQLFAGNSSGTATNPLSFFQSVPSAALNVSTRLAVGTSDIDWLTGGFIVTGNAPKKVIMRAIGASLTALGVSNALQDPTVDSARSHRRGDRFQRQLDGCAEQTGDHQQHACAS